MANEYFAGYLLQGVRTIIKKSPDNKLWSEVAKKLSAFYLSNFNLNSNEPEREHPILTILDNQISRGLPTLPTVYLENKFSELLGLTEKNTNKIGNISYDINEQNQKIALDYLPALAIVDTRLSETAEHISFQTWEEHSGSDFEQRFYNTLFARLFGTCTNQMLELQRSINSILEQTVREERATRNQLAELATRFFEQKADFVLQFPQIENYSKGLIIEIDGSQHQTDNNQQQLDNSRNQFARQNNWQTVRITTRELDAIPQDKKAGIENYLTHPFSQAFRKNVQKPLIDSKTGKTYLQAILSPFAIARIQKAVLKAFKKGLLDMGKGKVSIGIIERDVPCAYLAIEDLQQQIRNLSLLQTGQDNIVLPVIELQVFVTPEFKDCELNSGQSISVFEKDSNFENFDLLIDCAVLSTNYFLDAPIKSIPRKTIVIRSLHSAIKPRKFNFHPAITYDSLFEKSGEISQSKQASLSFFLQSLFRKQTFREGQLEILNEALQKKNPIALLPTGAGKSLTYQLASLLQPGLTIVVDPIKSLMKDQNENLIIAAVDATTYINSSLTPIERETNTRKFAEGEFLFAFVSPERFIVQPFRRTLAHIANNNKCFSYCVIDEAHCVSEWGHDFRTAYLKLGDNARSYCSTNIDSEKVPIIGLTGTASFDVLSDVQREVHLIDELSIIRPKKLEREELTFKVKVFNSNLTGTPIDWNIKNSVGAGTHQTLINLLTNDLLDEFNARTFSEFVKPNGEKTNCGIIFCPHKGGEFGVKKIVELLRNTFPDIKSAIGEFYGGGDGEDKVLDETQDSFKKNEISVLIATKAFGMGIDKPNIRFTIHITHPISIEGFYQEAGRAGRDREPAVCYILHCDNLRLRNGNSVAKDFQESFLNNSFRGPNNEKSIIFELLDRITYPHTPNVNQITSRILNENGKLCKLNLFPRHPEIPHTVYVNGEEFGTKYGQINLRTLQYTASDSIVAIPEAVEVLEQIRDIISTRPNGVSVIDWLKSINETPTEPGIEDLLSRIPKNQEEIITIGFENNGIQEIVDYLSNQDETYDYSVISSTLNFCFIFDDFITNLNKAYWRATNRNFNFNAQILADLEPLYNNIRLAPDSLKAVYRLSILGIVKDYIVNYAASTINLTCKNISDQQILENLIQYVSRYVTSVSAAEVRGKVIQSNETTMLRKCIDYLIDFTYEHIYQKRKIAMDNMEKAVQVAVTDGNEAFRIEVNNYFDSRYVEELRLATKNGELLDFTILFNFIEKVGNNKDEIKQLRGSSGRLLESYQTNGLFYWMRFYSSLLLKDRNLPNIKEDFKNGIKYFRNERDLSAIDCAIEQLKKEIENHDKESLQAFEELIATELTDIAVQKVKSMNKLILSDYGV